MAEPVGRKGEGLESLSLNNMGKDDIKEQEAVDLWELWRMLPDMVLQGLITQEEAAGLKPVLNDKLHEALGLSEK